MIVSLIRRVFQLMHFLVFSILLVISLSVSAKTHTIPDELYNGIIKFELNSGRYFDALVMMDESYKQSNNLDYLTALQGFNITQSLSELIKKAKKRKDLNDADYYKVGRIEYFQENCLPTLKSFKKIQNNLSLDDKEPWSFYRANCFIKLGSDLRAGQALNDVVGGIWAAYAYYNLAISYAETSQNKTRALKALLIAESLNTGKSKEANSLNDRINLAAGKLLLDAKKYDSAVQVFKKIHLNSESTPAGLYLNGLALLESGDFRAATQTWHSLKTYPVLNQSVAEAYLAIPYAFERSGYISQTLEAYLDASNTFEVELDKIDKIDAAVAEYGVAKVFIEDSEIAGLEWFLAKDVIKNTTQPIYYQHLMKNEDLYDLVRLYSELKMLQNSLDFWLSQLKVFDASLSKKQQSYKKERSRFDASSVLSKINNQKHKIDSLVSQPGMTSSLASNLQIDVLKNSIEVLKIRLDSLQDKVQKGGARLNKQLLESKALSKTIKSANKRLSALVSSLDEELTKAVRLQLSKLKTRMISNFERSEQGRVHLFEDMAESKQMKKSNLLDGRYK